MVGCPICNSYNVKRFLHLKMPIVLRSLPYKEAINVSIEELIIYNCYSCYTGFNITPLDDSIIEKIYSDYSGYISPFNNIGASKFNNIIQVIKSFIPIEESVTEIGCGDGYLLYLLKREGYADAIGFEPSKLANIGIKQGLKIINTFFRKEEMEKLNIKYTNFILSHFLEHVNNPVSLLKELKNFLNNSYIIIETPYFDGFHHEHLFFYTKKSIFKLAEKTGLELVYLKVMDTHPETLIAVFSDSNKSIKKYYIEKEETHSDFIKLIDRKRNHIHRNIYLLEKKVKQYNNILFWGAGSSAVFYLNTIKDVLDNKDVVIVSGDKRHEGNYIPGVLKQIENPFKYKNLSFDLIVVLSQFYEEIRENISKLKIKSNDLIWIY
jgi:SAM-dependent methyltransferase